MPILKNCALSTTLIPWVRLARAYWRNLSVLHTTPHHSSQTLKNGLRPYCEKNVFISTVSRGVSWMRMFSVVSYIFYYINQVLFKYESGQRDLSSIWKVQVPDTAPVTNLTQLSCFCPEALHTSVASKLTWVKMVTFKLFHHYSTKS